MLLRQSEHQERPIREGRFRVVAQIKYGNESFPGKGNSRCKDPEAGTMLMCLRESKAKVASASRGRRKGVEGKQAGGHELITLGVLAKRGRGMTGFLAVADEGWSHLQHSDSMLTPSPHTLWGLLNHSFSKNKLNKPLQSPTGLCQGWPPQARRALAHPCALAPGSSLATRGLRKQCQWSQRGTVILDLSLPTNPRVKASYSLFDCPVAKRWVGLEARVSSLPSPWPGLVRGSQSDWAGQQAPPIRSSHPHPVPPPCQTLRGL